MNCRAALSLCTVAMTAFLVACGPEPATDLTIEALPEVQPNLPAVPSLPPPPAPIQHSDSSYTIFGLRDRIRQTIDTDVEVTGYIVEIYAPPVCPEGETCARPIAPHLWIADRAGETDNAKRMMVVGYADNHEEIAEWVEAAARNRPMVREEGDTRPPIPIDFAVGNKIKVRGRFVRVSGAGFNSSEGLVEYNGHTTLESATPPEPSQ